MTTLMICWAQTTFFRFVDEAIPGWETWFASQRFTTISQCYDSNDHQSEDKHIKNWHQFVNFLFARMQKSNSYFYIFPWIWFLSSFHGCRLRLAFDIHCCTSDHQFHTLDCNLLCRSVDTNTDALQRQKYCSGHTDRGKASNHTRSRLKIR